MIVVDAADPSGETLELSPRGRRGLRAWSWAGCRCTVYEYGTPVPPAWTHEPTGLSEEILKGTTANELEESTAHHAVGSVTVVAC
jgi:hypothetical protein